jgi:hypothetical protein
VIEKFSFDMDEMVYPRGYDAFGVAIPLSTRVKLVPNIPSVAGQIFTQEVSCVLLTKNEADAHYQLGV